MRPIRFLADESCDFAVVRALRAAGYDVAAVGEGASRSDDPEVIARAHHEQRILLTEDKDFGWLVFVSHANADGVILMRFPGNARRSLVQAVMHLVEERGRELVGCFVVVQPGCVRISRRLPPRGTDADSDA